MSQHCARRRGLPFVLWLAASGLVAAAGTFLAQTPTWEFDLAIARLGRSDIRLLDFTRQGYRCARVARPEGAHVPRHVAILMGRPRDLRVWPAVSDIEVVVGGTEMRRQSFERDINRLAARGYEMCGFTIADAAAIGRQPYGLVAVMERLEQRAPSGVSYRVLHTTGRSEEWERVQASAADGYALAYMVARPGAATDSTHDNHYVVEKRPGAERAVAYRLERAGNEFDLQQRLDRAAKEGYRAESMWPGHDTITVLLSRPVEGAWEGRLEYEVDESSRLRTSTLTGPAIRFVPFKDSLFGFYDKYGATEDSANEGAFDDSERRPARAGDERELLRSINVDGGRGYWPSDFAIRQRETGSARLAAIVVLGRAKR